MTTVQAVIPDDLNTDLAFVANEIHRSKSYLICQALKYKGLWRYRVGAYRVLYAIEENDKTIIITNIDHRSKAY